MLGCSIIASHAHHRFASDSARSAIVPVSETADSGDPSAPGKGGSPDVDSAPPSAFDLDCRQPISALAWAAPYGYRRAPRPGFCVLITSAFPSAICHALGIFVDLTCTSPQPRSYDPDSISPFANLAPN